MYESCKVAIDPVIITIQHKDIRIYLKKREKEPFEGSYELPGGLLQENEDAQTILKRKLTEILKEHVFFTEFQTFTNPKRDPRERVISIGHIAIVPITYTTTQENWFSITQLPELAFDHKEIVLQSIEFLKKQLTELLAKHFLPEKFPLNALQEIYETVLDETYDNRNFRRKVLNSNIVKETHEYEKNVSHRPAKLFELVK